MDGSNGSSIDLLHRRWRASNLQEAKKVMAAKIVSDYCDFVDTVSESSIPGCRQLGLIESGLLRLVEDQVSRCNINLREEHQRHG